MFLTGENIACPSRSLFYLLFDHFRLIVDEMAVVQHCKDEVRLQQCANTIALMARKLSKDPKVRLNLRDMFLFYNMS